VNESPHSGSEQRWGAAGGDGKGKGRGGPSAQQRSGAPSTEQRCLTLEHRGVWSRADEDEAVLVIISTSPGPCGLHATREMQGAHDGMRVAWMRVACMRAIGCGWLACKPPACRMQCACQPVKDIRVVRLRDTGTWPIRLQCQLGYTACTSTCTPLSAPASP
jgi:hypothetical protein